MRGRIPVKLLSRIVDNLHSFVGTDAGFEGLLLSSKLRSTSCRNIESSVRKSDECFASSTTIFGSGGIEFGLQTSELVVQPVTLSKQSAISALQLRKLLARNFPFLLQQGKQRQIGLLRLGGLTQQLRRQVHCLRPVVVRQAQRKDRHQNRGARQHPQKFSRHGRRKALEHAGSPILSAACL